MSGFSSLNKIDAVVIGASAGGIEALGEILPALGKDVSFATIVVLHLSSQHKSLLAQVFAPKVKLPVMEAEDKMQILPGSIYFAPAGYHLLVESDLTFALTVEAPVHFSRPSIDVTFESAADVYGERAVGVVLSGANQDGTLGAGRLRAAGAAVIVQDPSTAQMSVMPASAAGWASIGGLLSPKEIAVYLRGVNR